MSIVNIEGYQFDFSKLIRLVTPTNKFWEAEVDGKKMHLRVGKIKGGTETNIEETSKPYPTPELARASVIEKIKEKLIKGYVLEGGMKEAPKDNNQLKRDPTEGDKVSSKSEPPKPTYSGQLLEKGGESVKLEVSGNKVRITRTGTDGRQKEEIQTFDGNDQAVKYCKDQQDWLAGESYKPNPAKFTNTFSDKPTKPTATKSSSNYLSITAMTDDAISRSSRDRGALSPTKSSRSARDDDYEDDFKPSALGPPTSACIKVLLAETWDDSVDPSGYYMSEKLDGVRCFWTGTQMYSRNGNRFFPPKFFTRNWPKSQLDGQLFIGRNKFSETLSAIKKSVPIDHEWEKVCYLVFDAPGLKKPFKERVKLMQEVLTQINNPHLKCHAHRICNSFTDMFSELQAVNKVKGQGLMLRDPQSKYQNRRSKTLLKVKTFYDDEATVLGYTEGSGRCHGMIGALKVRNTHGVEFEVGSGLNDDMRRRPPKVGTVITYKYQEFNEKSGKPRFPTFLRIYQPL